MKNSKWEKYNLTTITPIFIGSDQGSDLSKTTDFIVDGSQIKIIDQRKLEAILSNNIELIDEFVSGIKNKPQAFDLQFFIENKLNASVSELTKTTLDVDGYLSSNSVNTFITTNGKHFIPGSTIKGAIRTALIYNFLNDNVEGKTITASLLQSANKNFSTLQRLSEIKKERKLNDSEYRSFKEVERYKNNERTFSKIYNELILFKDKMYGHDFRHIKISDSNLIEPTNTKISELSRTYLIKDRNKTSQWKQLLKENVTTQFTLKIEEDFKDGFLAQLNSNSEKSLMQIINNFSKDAIEFELDMYKEFSKKKEISKKINAAKEFYEWLKDVIEKSNNEFTVIRIGGGKTYFDNSIGLALYRKNPKTFKEFRKLLGFWKHWDRSFVEEDAPITRTYYFKEDSLLPIGWVVIYKDELPDEFRKTTISKKSTVIKSDDKSKKNSVDVEKIDFSKLASLGKITQKKKK